MTRSFLFVKGCERVTAKKSGGSTASMARQLAEPYAQQLGVTLWDVLYLKEGASYILRYIIDKEGGVTIDDCENLSRAVDSPLDEADFIKESYFLEVSSPGLNRELKKPHHFTAMAGREVVVHLLRPQNGRRDFAGTLLGLTDGKVLLREADTTEHAFQLKGEVASVRLDDGPIDDTDDYEVGGTQENE